MAARSKPFCLWTSRWELCASLALSLSRDSVRGIAAHVRLCHFCTGTVKASGENRERPCSSIGPRQACPAGRPDLTRSRPRPFSRCTSRADCAALPPNSRDQTETALRRRYVDNSSRRRRGTPLPWAVRRDPRSSACRGTFLVCLGGADAIGGDQRLRSGMGARFKFGPTCH
jgi:hypothetical protein